MSVDYSLNYVIKGIGDAYSTLRDANDRVDVRLSKCITYIN